MKGLKDYALDLCLALWFGVLTTAFVEGIAKALGT